MARLKKREKYIKKKNRPMNEWNERKKEKKVAKKTLNDKTPPVPQREGKIGAHTQFD